MPLENKLLGMGQFQEWYSGQMENSYSSNCSLGGLYDWLLMTVVDCISELKPLFLPYAHKLLKPHVISVMIYVITECGEIVFLTPSLKKIQEVTILFNQMFGFLFQIQLHVCPPTTMGFEISDKENGDNQSKNS